MRWCRAHNARVPLLSAAVGLDADGRVRAVAADETDPQFFDGTRVLRRGGTSAQRAEEQRAWLAAGTRPARAAEYSGMVEKALLDIRTLTLPRGASVAG